MNSTEAMELRDLRTLEEFRAVRALELEIWGAASADDAMAVAVFAVTVKRGAILIGAYEGGNLVGFVYSFVGLRRGVLTQWSHMLGVRADRRHTGLGRALKAAQRHRAMAMGIELIEWSFDPLQAPNAHLNIRRLGAVAGEYCENLYGDSQSLLHRGAATDRLIAEWWVRSARVEAALAGAPAGGIEETGPVVLDAAAIGPALEPVRLVLGRSDPVVFVTIPDRFTDMLERDIGLAQAWRAATRDVLRHYLGRGYVVTDFVRTDAGGRYRLSASVPPGCRG